MEAAGRIQGWCYLYESLQTQIARVEWFRDRYPDNRALRDKINALKEQSGIAVELIRAELRAELDSESAA